MTSSAIYRVIVDDVYVDEAFALCGAKVHNALASSLPSPMDPLSVMADISSKLVTTSAPAYLLAFHFSLIQNALATARRMRHQNKLRVDQVGACHFCGEGQDSLGHIFAFCPIVSHARSLFFSSLSLPLPPPCSPALSPPPPIPPRSHKHNHSIRSLSSSLLSGEEVSGRASRGGVSGPLPLAGAASAHVSLSSLCPDGLGNGVAIPSFEEPEPAHGPFVSTGLSQGIFDAPSRAPPV